MGGGKNQLRFPESVWEDADHYKMDNYTNRIQCSEMCEILDKIGFKVVDIKREKYAKSPIGPILISPDVNCESEEDLVTHGATIILMK